MLTIGEATLKDVRSPLGESLVSRRRFLGSAAAAALAAGAAQVPLARAQRGPARLVGYPFTLGVASGDPLPDSVVLWTRLAPAALSGGGMPDRAVEVRWEVADDEGFSRVVRRGTEVARPALGHSVHAEPEGLQPGREYFYRFIAEGEASPTGRAKTAPIGSPASLVFAFASCQQYEHGYFTSYQHMAREDLDFVVHLGDYIYEYEPNDFRAAGGNVRAHSGPEIITLDDYRNRYAQYKSDPDLQAAHAAFSWLVTWDDHEIDNNWADEVPEDGQPREAFLRRRASAFQAYYEHMPLRRASRPTGIDLQLYRRLAFGDLASFNVLDTRQYRSDQPCDDRSVVGCDERLDPARTLTGEEQERWLLDGLGASRATWNVLAQQVFFAQRDFNTDDTQRFSTDAWDGYAANRDRILGFVEERNVANPIVITGDVHNNWACDLKADFDDPESRTLGSEFVGTSISTGGNGTDTTPFGEGVVEENPHIKFNNGQRGYVRCALNRETWRTDFRVVPYVKRPGAPVETLRSFVVEAGNPGLNPA
ncbi:MAG: alkaline phosphatase D family protein [Actinomycetota bacterium]|nr:alkaline phosphatase D family protein [Actinomycetota bacterium]